MKISHISKRYGQCTVLSDVSITFEHGQIYGIMGENGAGKSTLFRCMTGLETCEGTVTVDSSTTIGYLNDTPYFYPLVTAREFIDFCLRARGMKADETELHALNNQLRLPLHQYPSTYSMGMKKRLMLLILMLQKSDIYIMDEPFNGLDLSGSLLLKQWMMDMKAQGRLVILSSHIISSLTDICHEILYIHQGKIVKRFRGESPETIENEIRSFILST